MWLVRQSDSETEQEMVVASRITGLGLSNHVTCWLDMLIYSVFAVLSLELQLLENFTMESPLLQLPANNKLLVFGKMV